jgi:hypothetical protein
MCKIFEPIEDKKSVTGYKIVITDKYGHHYSPYTGVRYKKGLIPIVKNKLSNALNDGSIFDILQPYSMFYNKNYAGMTAVIISKYNAKIELQRFRISSPLYNFTLLEMTLSGDLHYGEYSKMQTYIGRNIISFKKIKNSN